MPQFDRVFSLNGFSFHELPGVRFALWQSQRDRLYTGVYECKREELLETLDTSQLLAGDFVVGSSSSAFRREFWRTSDDVAVYASITGESASFTVAATSQEALRNQLAYIRERLPSGASEDGRAEINFWAGSERGARPVARQLAVPPWDEIRANYSLHTREAIERVVAMDRSSAGEAGRLILWHGAPGTGKSFAIRSLLHEWQGWCRGQYIMDPERFFGQPDYMLDVFLNVQRRSDMLWDEFGEELIRKPAGQKDWSLLIIEDADEFLTRDAKERAGQSVSRLLSLTDGFIGQGLNVLVLITTNEELGRLHPAIRRPGRCAADVLFGPLSREEAAAWYPLHAHEPHARQGSTVLADLYASLHGRDNLSPEPAQIGFQLPGARAD